MAKGRYHWSHGAFSARFLGVSAIASVPWFVCLMWTRWPVFYFAVGFTLFLIWVEIIKKMTLRAFFRSLNVTLTGRVKTSLNVFKEIQR